MKCTFKNMSAVTLAMVTAMTMVQTPIYAEENNKESANQSESSNSQVTKEETVYVITDASGENQNVIVSDWLKNLGSEDQISDFSTLFDIENVEGNQTFSKNADGSLTWQADGKDIYYQGTTNEALPINVKLTYQLDGKKVSAEDLAGKDGHVVIRFDYENSAKQEVEINGKVEEITVPFTMVSGLKLDQSKFENITVTNGKVISEGKNTFVVGIAFPGLKESLNLKEDSKIDIPEYVEIEADVTDFALDMTMTMASNQLLSQIDGDGIDTSELTEGLDQLTDASNQLLEGSKSLKDATGKLKDGASTLLDGASTLKDGTNTLAEGSLTIANGSSTLASGASQLQEGASKLQSGVNTLGENTNALAQGLLTLDQTLNTNLTDVKKAQLANIAIATRYTDQLNTLMKPYGASLDMQSMELKIDDTTMKTLIGYGVIDQNGVIQEDTIAKLKQLPSLLASLKASGLINDQNEMNTETKKALLQLGVLNLDGTVNAEQLEAYSMQLPTIASSMTTLVEKGYLNADGTPTDTTKVLLSQVSELNQNGITTAEQLEQYVQNAKKTQTQLEGLGFTLEDLPKLQQMLTELENQGILTENGLSLNQLPTEAEMQMIAALKGTSANEIQAQLAQGQQLQDSIAYLQSNGLMNETYELTDAAKQMDNPAITALSQYTPEQIQAMMQQNQEMSGKLQKLISAGLMSENYELNEAKVQELESLQSVVKLLIDNQLIEMTEQGTYKVKTTQTESVQSETEKDHTIAELENTVDSLTEQLNTMMLSDSNAVNTDTTDSLNQQINELATTTSLQSSEIEQLKAQLAEKDAQINALNTTINEKDQTIANLQAEKDNAVNQASEKDAVIANLQSQIEALQSMQVASEPIEQAYIAPIEETQLPADTEVIPTTDETADSVAYYTSLSTTDVTQYVVESAKNGTSLSDIEAFMKAYTEAITQAAGNTGAVTALEGILNNPGYQQIIAGAQALNTAVNDESASGLKGGVNSLANGAWQLKEGTTTLSSGAWSLNEGAVKLNSGAAELLDGIVTLKDGTVALDDGAKTLMEGMQQFEEEGISKLVDELNGEFGDTLNRLEAIVDAGKAYQTFSGANDGEADGVKFIFKTKGIEKD